MGIVRISIAPALVNAPPPRPQARGSRWRIAVERNKKPSKRTRERQTGASHVSFDKGTQCSHCCLNSTDYVQFQKQPSLK